VIRPLAQRIVVLWGWRRWLAAFLAGAVGALAMPPFGLFPALAVSFTVAIWLIDGATAPPGRRLVALRSAFAAGWWFGFGYFLAGLWWIGEAFLVDAEGFMWLMPFAVIGLPMVLALFSAVAFALARGLWSAGAGRLFAFAAAMAATEWLRGHVLTGFPWNAYGYALAGEVHLAQVLSVIGLPALTLVAVVILGSPALLADPPKTSRWSRRVPALAVLGLVGLAAFGWARLASTEVGTVPGVKIRIMQPAIMQLDKFRPELRDEILKSYIDLSERPTGPDTPGLDGVTLLIWPESAFPFLVSEDADALADIALMLPPGATLLTGAGRAEPSGSDPDARYYNSVHVIDTNGTIADTYDKVHLVPFGEYLPFQERLEALGLQALTEQRGGFSAGPRLRTLDIPGAPPAGILICYEAIFPGDVTDPGRRPAWLLNVTNDAWFGLTPGPYQHFLQARARTVEEGLPLVRAGNDGISAVVDPLGRVLESLPLGSKGVLDGNLPKSLPKTIYASIGDTALAALMLVSLLFAVFGRLKT
jgi:apolipoprotein N-acyltransferase